MSPALAKTATPGSAARLGQAVAFGFRGPAA
jgi:hypothetical protein